MKLQNRVAIITGGGSGIGEAIAHALASEGAHIVLAGRRQQALDRVAQDLQHYPGQVLAIRTDVTDEVQIGRLVKATLDTLDRVDILVNNAGIGTRGVRVLDTSTELWDQVMAVNLRAAFLCSRAVLPAMLAQADRGIQPPGIIVNISSEAGKTFGGASVAYTTSKWGLVGFSGALEAEVLDRGIKVVAVCPGMVLTEMTEHYPEAAKTRFLKPADVAELVRWVCTTPPHVRISEVMIRTMRNPWEEVDKSDRASPAIESPQQ